MREPVTPLTEQQAELRRARARRMAWVFAGVALLVYVGFILSGVLGAMSDKPRNLGLAKMAGVALAAFGFTFSLVPLYRIACEKVFGVRLEQGRRCAWQRPRPRRHAWSRCSSTAASTPSCRGSSNPSS